MSKGKWLNPKADKKVQVGGKMKPDLAEWVKQNGGFPTVEKAVELYKKSIEDSVMKEMDRIKKVSEPKNPCEENFEVQIEVKGGTRGSRNNFATCLNRLESDLRFSQHEESSKILSFKIDKVIRDEKGNIISSTPVISS